MTKRIMVDMSAAIIHHGHIRLLKNAAKYGKVIVGLTSDEEILKKKFFEPELSFIYRKEILESISYVSEVVEVPWLIDEKILKKFDIDLLIHGSDNSNLISENKLLIFDRTKEISSSIIRNRALKAKIDINNQKLMLTPGPAQILSENLQSLKPVFGRNDEEYDSILSEVLEWVKGIAGQDIVVPLQGSATLAIEISAKAFLKGKVLIVSTGYYSDRLKKLIPPELEMKKVKYSQLDTIKDNFDWVLCSYVETSEAFKVDLNKIKDFATKNGAKLFIDATGSIGLEDNHDLADVMAFSSCKGLFGLAGAAFIAYKKDISYSVNSNFFLNIETHINKLVTGPYHAICSLHGVIRKHSMLKKRVENSKNLVLERYKNLTFQDNQPNLCTYLNGRLIANDKDVVLYQPRTQKKGSIVCHLGEIFSDELKIIDRIRIENN